MDESEITTGVIIQEYDEDDETEEKDERDEKEENNDKQNISIIHKRPLLGDSAEQEESQKKMRIINLLN